LNLEPKLFRPNTEAVKETYIGRHVDVLKL